ncbi:MAG: hypothetical protein ACXV3C_06450 [Actinomycetes bacterium]
MRLLESRRGDPSLPGAGGRRPKSHRRRPDRSHWLTDHGVPVAAALAVLAVVVGAVLYAMPDDTGGSGGTGGASGGASGTVSAPAVSATEAAQLARWVAVNVRAGSTVVVPPSLAARVHVAAPALHVQAYDGAPPAGADLVVVSRTPSHQLQALETRTFPLARLPGDGRLEVRQVTDVGGAAAWRNEVRRLADAGAQLAQNRRLDLPASDARALRAGEVDARLLITLAALAGEHTLQADLVADPAGVPGSVRYRQVRITRVDGVSVARNPKVAAPLDTFVRAQHATLVPVESRVRRTTSGPAFVMRYPVPVPLGLIDGNEIPTVGP